MGITEQIIAFATDHPALIGVIIFLATFSEAIVVVGAVVPGAAVVIVLAGVVGAARGAIVPLLLWATAGAIVGDSIAYWIGRRYGPQLRDRWPFRLRPALFDKGERFFQRYGTRSLLIGRFVPGLRAFTPVAAGTLGMRPAVFFPTSVAAAAAWAIVHILPSAAAGVLLSAVGRISSRLVAGIVLFIVLVVLAVWLARLAVNIIGPAITSAYGRAVGALTRSPNPTRARIGRLLDPTVANITAHILWGVVILFCAIGVLAIIQDLVAGQPLVQTDAAIRQFTQSFRNAPLDQVMVLVSALGSTPVFVASAAALVVALFVGGARRTAAIVATVFAATLAFVPLIGLLFTQQRPIELVPEFAAFSFPSSHATFAALFCGVIAVLLSTSVGATIRVAVWAVGFLVALLVGLARIYLDAQWASDVGAGLLLGLALTAIFAMIRNGFQDELGRSPQIPLIAFAAFLAIGAVKSSVTYEADLARATPRTSLVEMSESEWLAAGWERLPARRVDLFGATEETVLVQTPVDPTVIAAGLAAAGWEQALPFTSADFLFFLVPAAPLDTFSPLPLLHGGRLPDMTFIRPHPDPARREVFRLWSSGFAIRDGAAVREILVGSTTEERVSHPYDALTIIQDRPAPPELVEQLRSAVAGLNPNAANVSERNGSAGPVILVAPR
jgi:membrane protein DedA with SNARE-associated domain/membrane-associated phospholipid phosphatase